MCIRDRSSALCKLRLCVKHVHKVLTTKRNFVELKIQTFIGIKLYTISERTQLGKEFRFKLGSLRIICTEDDILRYFN